MRAFNIGFRGSLPVLASFLVVPLAWGGPLEEPHQYVPKDIEEYTWEEQETEIPPYPKDENLLEFHVDSADARSSYYIDTESLNINEKDGIVRYTLVMKLGADQKSVSYEGMKCSSREYKVYAFGGRNGEMRPATRAKWRPIRRSGSNLYHRDLWDFYLCNDRALARGTKEQILDAFRYPDVDRKDRGFVY